MTGLNQTIMMAIAMVVTCSMIGTTGLGQEVLISINRLETGRGFSARISAVIIAIIIDRLTQELLRKERQKLSNKKDIIFKIKNSPSYMEQTKSPLLR